MLGKLSSRSRQLIWLIPALCAAFLPSSIQAQNGGPVVPARAELSPLDQPIAWLSEGKRNFSVVKDYTCHLVSRERVKGVLLDQNIIEFKSKSEPFSVSMRWLAPDKFKGQEVVYVTGKNSGKMRVKSNFLGAGIVGFVNVDPTDPRVFQHSRHTIVEAGIANMIEQNLKHWQLSKSYGKTKVTVGESKYDKRDCIRIEITTTERHAGAYCYRSIIYLEKESKIPIRLEIFDWPRQGAPDDGELLETYSYVGLRFNTGLKDDEFNK